MKILENIYYNCLIKIDDMKTNMTGAKLERLLLFQIFSPQSNDFP